MKKRQSEEVIPYKSLHFHTCITLRFYEKPTWEILLESKHKLKFCNLWRERDAEYHKSLHTIHHGGFCWWWLPLTIMAHARRRRGKLRKSMKEFKARSMLTTGELCDLHSKMWHQWHHMKKRLVPNRRRSKILFKSDFQGNGTFL